ncbi:hypothetical protein TRVL_06629 [Trypanosoma vivax]|uniref:Uncharacterized protein n=1 Tax=Trypanosoma vivax (strain Y486) TaxID=1055687 RepID=G0UBW7_TRYVY|nr:hypothetical protein TRVL_06629 [Trypanosoma vivax]CCC53315.1 hypothetical protein TVY486_1107990 [Trypanosoma vivax Y486]
MSVTLVEGPHASWIRPYTQRRVVQQAGNPCTGVLLGVVPPPCSYEEGGQVGDCCQRILSLACIKCSLLACGCRTGNPGSPVKHLRSLCSLEFDSHMDTRFCVLLACHKPPSASADCVGSASGWRFPLFFCPVPIVL